MPYPVRLLLQGRPQPVTVTAQQSARDALDLMLTNDFSQLPVIDEHEKPIGMITSDSIVHALFYFQASIGDLRVVDVTDRAPRTFSHDSDVFELLKELSDKNAVLIVNREGKLTGIVTNYDTSEFFRRRSEDIMMVEEIEKTIRELILKAFPHAHDLKNDPILQAAVKKVTAPERDEEIFNSALLHYIKGKDEAKTKLDEEKARASYSILIGSSRPPKSFEKLTYTEYVAMLLHDDRWEMYSAAIPLRKTFINNMLRGIADVRNKIAHFSGELTATERRRLQLCANWLQNHYEAIAESVTEALKTQPSPVTGILPRDPADSSVEVPEPTGTSSLAPDPNSIYAALATYLQSRAQTGGEVEMSFKEIEDKIGFPLPELAYKYRSWWSNDPDEYSHVNHWLEAGWRVNKILLNKQMVTFSRRNPLADAFIAFFAAVKRGLIEASKDNIYDFVPTGRESHITAEFSFSGKIVAAIVLQFYDDKLGCGLHLLPKHSDQAKYIVEGLLREKDDIDAHFGQELEWQPISMIGYPVTICEIDAKISPDEEAMKSYKEWAISTVSQYCRLFFPRIEKILSEFSTKENADVKNEGLGGVNGR